MIVVVLENDFFGFKWLTEEFKITITWKVRKSICFHFPTPKWIKWIVYPLIFFTVSNGLNASFLSVCFQDFFLSRSRVIVRKFNVNSSLTGLKCKGQNSPVHGSLTCHEDTTTKEVSCTLKCDHGYDVEFLAAERYVCNTDGTWRAQPLSTGSRWPNCKKYRWICTEK